MIFLRFRDKTLLYNCEICERVNMDTLISKTKIHDKIAAEATIKKNLMVQGACSSWRLKALTSVHLSIPLSYGTIVLVKQTQRFRIRGKALHYNHGLCSRSLSGGWIQCQQ